MKQGTLMCVDHGAISLQLSLCEAQYMWACLRLSSTLQVEARSSMFSWLIIGTAKTALMWGT